MLHPFTNDFASAQQVSVNILLGSLRVLVQKNYKHLKQVWSS